jgi:type I restriction enzyme R subunit
MHFELASFKPKTSLNVGVHDNYNKNIFSVMRQVRYSLSNNNSIDMVLFLNGLPIYTFELKNQLTGQNVHNAMNQYRTDRDANEKLLRFKRCIAHFAVDTDDIYVTTRLDDEKTFFLPFNKGNDNGAGNPVADGKHKTYYLWEEFLVKDVVLDMLEAYIHTYEETKEKRDGKNYKEWTQLFPRYHQYKAVSNIIDSCKNFGAGKNYLIQHSAGSGKSLTIAWLSYRLAELHSSNDEKVYDSVMVLTDRKVLDKQLRNTIRNLCQVEGVLKTIDESQSSKDLRTALEDGAKIITSTIHKFPMIVDTVSDISNKKFAIIVDEAHSSQSGEMVKDMINFGIS